LEELLKQRGTCGNKDNEGVEKQGAKDTKGGPFTRRLTWWRIVFALLVVGYLLYGSYQANLGNPDSTAYRAPEKLDDARDGLPDYWTPYLVAKER
jgi:hypothetical protein